MFVNKKCSYMLYYHSLKISSESMRVEETYEILAISYHKMKKNPRFYLISETPELKLIWKRHVIWVAYGLLVAKKHKSGPKSKVHF